MLVMYCPALHPIVTHLLKISTTLSSQNILVRFPSKHPSSTAIHLFISSDFVMDYLQTCVLDEEGEPDFNRSATFFDQIENAGRGSLLIVQVT